MYYNHFGLTQPPFRITPNTEFFYSGGNRGPILEALIYAIAQGEGIIKVTGEVGSGKTMLCSMLQSRLPPNVETVYLANPSVPAEEILHAIAVELHLKPSREATHLEVMHMLHAHLLERHAEGKQVVMFVEESQSMPLATLEEMRLLSNLETANSKLLQIVLFGQPELDDNLRLPQIRQLRERITNSFRLSPLSATEISDYLNFRLRAAGYHGPNLFSLPVINAIAKASAGLTRRVNLIADKSLLAAFSENTHTLTLKHVEAAIRDSEFATTKSSGKQMELGFALSMIGIGAGIGVGVFAMFMAVRGRDPTPPPAPARPPAVSAPTGTTPTANGAAQAAASAPSAHSNETPREVAQPAPQGKPDLDASVAAAPDSVEIRLLKTEQWLAEQPTDTYSIQLMVTVHQAQLTQHLNVLSKYLEIDSIFVYRTIAKDKPSLTVLYGSFSDRASAVEAMNRLPQQLKINKPFLRTVHGVRAEIEKLKRTS